MSVEENQVFFSYHSNQKMLHDTYEIELINKLRKLEGIDWFKREEIRNHLKSEKEKV